MLKILEYIFHHSPTPSTLPVPTTSVSLPTLPAQVLVLASRGHHPASSADLRPPRHPRSDHPAAGGPGSVGELCSGVPRVEALLRARNGFRGLHLR